MAKLDPFRSPLARARFLEKYDAVVAAWPIPCDERDVATDFGSTHVLVSGLESGPPLVLLHGAACTAVMWRPVIEALGATHRCYSVDTIVEGNKSIASRRCLGRRSLVSWLRQVLDALDIPNASVAGLSYGGWLAANLALQAPERVNRLVLLCPAATFAPIVMEFYRGVFSANLLRSPERARRFVRWLSTTPDADSDPVADLVVANLLSNRSVPTSLTPPTVLSDESLRRIGVPTTVLIGEGEVIYRGGPRVALARAGLIPDVRTRLIADAGHLLTVDAPGQLTDELLAALA